MDALKNFAYSTIATPPSGTGGTTLVVQTGDGSKFPAAPFNVTIWPRGVPPTADNAEIVRVTAKASDTFTITRAQEGTSARTWSVNAQVAQAITKRMIDGAARLYNVKAYGALGDGVTDDTAAVQSAITACNTAGGGRVYLPSGDYLLSADLVLQSDMEFFGDGAATTLTGTLSTTTDPVLYAQTENNVWIHDLVIAGTHSWGIIISGGSGHRVERCTISGGTRRDTSGSKGGGIFVENCSNVVIKDNVLSGNGVADGVAWFDILANFGSYAITDSEVSGNQCLSTTAEISIALFDPYRTRVTGNTCTGAKTPSSTPTTGGYGIALYKNGATAASAIGECDVSHNNVRSVEGTGIYIQSVRDTRVALNFLRDVASEQTDTSLTVGGVGIHDSPGCIVTGNRVYTSGMAGIGVTGTSLNTTVTSNYVDGCARLGVAIRGTVTDVTVANNDILNCVRDGIGSWSDLNASRISVLGNRIRTITGGGYRGIYAAPTATSWTIRDNDISDLSGGGAAITATTASHVVDGWSGSATFNPSNLADAAGETTTVTVTGAALGDYAKASFSLDLQGITLTAWVSAANTVSVRFQNESGGALDLASGTLTVRVTRGC